MRPLWGCSHCPTESWWLGCVLGSFQFCTWVHAAGQQWSLVLEKRPHATPLSAARKAHCPHQKLPSELFLFERESIQVWHKNESRQGSIDHVPSTCSQTQNWHKPRTDFVFSKSKIVWGALKTSSVVAASPIRNHINCQNQNIFSTISSTWQTLQTQSCPVAFVPQCTFAFLLRPFWSWKGWRVITHWECWKWTFCHQILKTGFSHCPIWFLWNNATTFRDLYDSDHRYIEKCFRENSDMTVRHPTVFGEGLPHGDLPHPVRCPKVCCCLCPITRFLVSNLKHKEGGGHSNG